MMRGGNRRLGDWGETKACDFLVRHGFTIIERNFQTPAGEIDIIAKLRGDYYFVEVKTRGDGDMAYDVAVTAEKKRRLRKTVGSYCYKRGLREAGLVLASLMVIVDKHSSTIRCRLAVLI
ncbi:MAG: YraN family protein [Candidatus Magasanikbacteria bacterium]|nr:YraN family protein [Candidatus Magasanikbacteria bacterium]